MDNLNLFSLFFFFEKKIQKFVFNLKNRIFAVNF